MGASLLWAVETTSSLLAGKSRFGRYCWSWPRSRLPRSPRLPSSFSSSLLLPTTSVPFLPVAPGKRPRRRTHALCRSSRSCPREFKLWHVVTYLNYRRSTGGGKLWPRTRVKGSWARPERGEADHRCLEGEGPWYSANSDVYHNNPNCQTSKHGPRERAARDRWQAL